MKWDYRPTHGVRFFATDAVAIVACGLATLWGLRAFGEIAWFFPFVLGHFFLFCNVFRIPRQPELVWATCFLFITAGCVLARIPILHAMWLVLPVTLGVVIHALRLPNYHGIGSSASRAE